MIKLLIAGNKGRVSIKYKKSIERVNLVDGNEKLFKKDVIYDDQVASGIFLSCYDYLTSLYEDIIGMEKKQYFYKDSMKMEGEAFESELLKMRHQFESLMGCFVYAFEYLNVEPEEIVKQFVTEHGKEYFLERIKRLKNG